MSSQKIVTSPKMYVGYQNRNDGEDGEIKLGFATYCPLDETKKQKDAYEKRKSTVDGWHESRTYNYQTRVWTESTLETEFVDNSEPLDGFKIARSVRRYGWGSGNVLWRIEDPRGFELEISSANMASILDSSTLIHGVIGGKCIWGWTGGKVVLLPEDSQPYKEAINTTKMVVHSVSAKDVNIGDKVQLQNGTIGVWAGRLHYACASRGTNSGLPSSEYYDGRGNNGESYGVLGVGNKTKGFLVQDDGNVYMVASPKFGQILEASGGSDKEYGADLVNKAFQAGGCTVSAGYGEKIIAVSATKIEREQLSFATRPTDEEYDVSKRTIWWKEENRVYSTTYSRKKYVMNLQALDDGLLGPIYRDITTGDLGYTGQRWNHSYTKRLAVESEFDFETSGVNYDQIAKYVNNQERIEVIVKFGDYELPLIGIYSVY